MMKRMFLISVALAASQPAFAASLEALSPAGKYGLDRAACKARDYFATIADTKIVLPTFSCEGVDYDQSEKKGAQATYKVTAKSCVGEGESKGKPQSFGLVRTSNVVQFFWADGTKSAKLVRCGK